MTVRSQLLSILQNEDLNFLLTNRIPRRWATRFIGWFSRIEQPLVRDISLAIWRAFSDLDLSDARRTRFRSMHDCFVRELKDGARPLDLDPSVLVSPCDAIVGASGAVADTEVFQVKGFPYRLRDLFDDAAFEETYRNGRFVTLRLTAGMYHRFHAPHDCAVERVSYLSGDTWNVNPIALRRVEKLFCKNERAVVRTRLCGSDDIVTLVPVAAILVASIRLHCLDGSADLRARGASPRITRDRYCKGDEMGWFQHGSTIVVFAPGHFMPCRTAQEGARIRMGEPLFLIPPSDGVVASSH